MENEMEGDVERTNEYNALEVLVGKWAASGKTIASDDEPEQIIEGTDEYQWQPGKFFLRHDAEVTFGGQVITVLELIGPYSKQTNDFAMRAFDSLGNFEAMQASVDEDGIWTFANEGARATLTPAYDGKTMAAIWERKTDIGWTHWMDISFTRMA